MNVNSSLRLVLRVVLLVLFAAPVVSAAPAADLPRPIIVDHTSVALFEQIPASYLQAAQATSMLFMDRSVGGNISDGLTCLGYASDEAAPSHCKRFTHVDPRYSVSATEVNWSRTGGYSRANWDYLYWPTGCDSWDSKLGCFFDLVDQQPGAYQVVSYQFSYLEVETGSTIDDLPGGFFANNAGKLDVYDLEAFQAQHPELTVIHWTTSLARGIGTADSESFNAQLRQYALSPQPGAAGCGRHPEP